MSSTEYEGYGSSSNSSSNSSSTSSSDSTDLDDKTLLEEYQKAKEFYLQLIAINNLQRDIFDKAKYQLTLINDK